MKLDNYYDLEYLDYCPHPHCYNHNASADMSLSPPQVFHVEFGSPYRIPYLNQVQSQQQVRLTRNTYCSLTLVPGHGLQNWISLLLCF